MEALTSSFIKLSYNPSSKRVELIKSRDLCNIYMTQDSIVTNFNKVFGYNNEALAVRLYNIMADGKRGVHIYLPTYCMKLQGIIEGFPLQLNLFGFDLLDSKLQGKVYASDLADIIVNVLAQCPDTQRDKIYPILLG